MTPHLGMKMSSLPKPKKHPLAIAVYVALRAGPAAVFLSASPMAFSQGSFGAVVELSALDGSDGYVINGENASDQSGISVSGAGDINGDGIDDLIIGAKGADFSSYGAQDVGRSYVVFGGSAVGNSGMIELSGLTASEGLIIIGNDASSYSGSSVSGAGDVNGDTFDDLIIGASYATVNGNTGAGESYVVFGAPGIGGSTTPFVFDGTDGFVINGIDSGDYSGFSVSEAGDINGDSIDDLIIGATGASPNTNDFSGESYVVFGGSSLGGAGEFDLADLDGTDGFVINGIDAYDQSGFSVSSAGDFNADGIDDLIIGASFAEPNGTTSAGESYVVFGGSGVGSSGEIELSDLDGTDGFVINGIDSYDNSGSTVSGAGDVNDDGVADIVISAPSATPNGNAYSGETYVVFGGSGVGSAGELELSDLDGSNGFVLNGIEAFDQSAVSVSGAGDINGDGVDDLIIGANFADPNANASGESYVVFGGQGLGGAGVLELSSLDGNNGFVINGIDANDGSGISVSAAGDVNGDGLDDLIIGADSADPNGSSSGESYVLFGQARCNGLTVTVNLNLGQETTANSDVVMGTSGADDIRGKAGDDTICGMGGDDFIHGNSGDDWIDGGDGVDNLRGGQGNDVVNTGSGSTVGTSSRAFGGKGDDEINGGADADDLRGGRGVDTINGFGGDDEITGNEDDDFLKGGKGFDLVKGGNGDDDLQGGADNDALNGGAGDDVLNGGSGSSDVCDGGNGTGDSATASCEQVINVP